jgi:hypothetical protein
MELVVMRDLKSLVCNGRAGSSPARGTRIINTVYDYTVLPLRN